MSSDETSAATATPTAGRRRPPGRLSVANHVGLGLAALLAVVDVGSMAAISQPEVPGQNGPPAEVLWFGCSMGLVTLVMLALAWAGRWRRPAIRLAAVTRVLSAVGALPAFFVGGVPAVLVAAAAATVVLTLVAIALMLLRPRPRPRRTAAVA